MWAAEMLPFVFDATGVVVIANVALLDPAGTCTVVGTVAAVWVSVNVTVMFAAAVPVRVTVPVDWLPPVTVAGLRASWLKAAAFTVSARFRVTP